MILWRSSAVRSYQRGTRSFLQPELPASIRDRVLDADKNGIPDSMDARDTNSDGKPDTTNTPRSELESYYKSQGNGANISNSSSMFRASVSDG